MITTEQNAENRKPKTENRGGEAPIGLVPGTRDWLTTDCARLAALESRLLDAFGAAS